jgi:hypothetical protein
MIVEKLRAMLKFLRQTHSQTHRLFQKGQIRYQESILRHFRAKKKKYSKIPRNGQSKLKMPTSALLNVGIKRYSQLCKFYDKEDRDNN